MAFQGGRGEIYIQAIIRLDQERVCKYNGIQYDEYNGLCVLYYVLYLLYHCLNTFGVAVLSLLTLV